MDQAWSRAPIIPALEKLREEENHKFKANLNYIGGIFLLKRGGYAYVVQW